MFSYDLGNLVGSIVDFNEVTNCFVFEYIDFVVDYDIDHKIPESAENIEWQKAAILIFLPFENDGVVG